MSMRKSPTMSKSLNKFVEPNGVVGLGILAAMNDMDQKDPIFSKNKPAIVVVSPRSSNPISFFSQRNDFYGKNVRKRPTSFEEMEMCEEYTCVISHVGNNWVKKKEYFDGDFLGVVEGSAEDFGVAFGGGDGGSVNGSAMGHGGDGGDATEGLTDDFLDSCFFCKKKLHGLDIFMYRGEKAFCSAECRDKQISIDEHKEKYVSGVMKPSEHSVSPCSSPMQFVAGVAAA